MEAEKFKVALGIPPPSAYCSLLAPDPVAPKVDDFGLKVSIRNKNAGHPPVLL
jgi:hypothetical protein